MRICKQCQVDNWFSVNISRSKEKRKPRPALRSAALVDSCDFLWDRRRRKSTCFSNRFQGALVNKREFCCVDDFFSASATKVNRIRCFNPFTKRKILPLNCHTHRRYWIVFSSLFICSSNTISAGFILDPTPRDPCVAVPEYLKKFFIVHRFTSFF